MRYIQNLYVVSVGLILFFISEVKNIIILHQYNVDIGIGVFIEFSL